MQYAFYSAANAAAIQQARQERLEAQELSIAEQYAQPYVAQAEAASTPGHSDGDAHPLRGESGGEGSDDEAEDAEVDEDGDEGPWEDEGDEDLEEGNVFFIHEPEDSADPRARVLTVLELEALFQRAAPDLSSAYIKCREVFLLTTSQCSPTHLKMHLLSSLWVSLDTPTLANQAPLTLSSARRKSACPPLPGKRNISKPYSCLPQ